MRYEILVEGGFTGIPRKFEGKLNLDRKEISVLLESMNAAKPININLRDGHLYNVTLFDNEKTVEAQFEEKTLPGVIRRLVSE